MGGFRGGALRCGFIIAKVVSMQHLSLFCLKNFGSVWGCRVWKDHPRSLRGRCFRRPRGLRILAPVLTSTTQVRHCDCPYTLPGKSKLGAHQRPPGRLVLPSPCSRPGTPPQASMLASGMSSISDFSTGVVMGRPPGRSDQSSGMVVFRTHAAASSKE